MTGAAALIQAIAALLWPFFAFTALGLFRNEIREALGQIKRLKKGKFLGQEIELDDRLSEDRSSHLLNDYLFPFGIYRHDRAELLNSLLREMGVIGDVRLILDGADGMPLRQRLIKYAMSKGLELARPTDGHSEL